MNGHGPGLALPAFVRMTSAEEPRGGRDYDQDIGAPFSIQAPVPVIMCPAL